MLFPFFLIPVIRAWHQLDYQDPPYEPCDGNYTTYFMKGCFDDDKDILMNENDTIRQLETCRKMCDDSPECWAFEFNIIKWTLETYLCRLLKYHCRSFGRRLLPDPSATARKDFYCTKAIPKLHGYFHAVNQKCIGAQLMYTDKNFKPQSVEQCAFECSGNEACHGFYFGKTQNLKNLCSMVKGSCEKGREVWEPSLFFEKSDESVANSLNSFDHFPLVAAMIRKEHYIETLPKIDDLEACSRLCSNMEECLSYTFCQECIDPCMRYKTVADFLDQSPAMSHYYIKKAPTFEAFMMFPYKECKWNIGGANHRNISINQCYQYCLNGIGGRRCAAFTYMSIPYDPKSEAGSKVSCITYEKYPCEFQEDMKHSTMLTYVRPAYQNISRKYERPTPEHQYGYDYFPGYNCLYNQENNPPLTVIAGRDEFLSGPYSSAQCAKKCDDTAGCQMFWHCEIHKCKNPLIQCRLGYKFCPFLFKDEQWSVYRRKLDIEGFIPYVGTTCANVKFSSAVYGTLNEVWGPTVETCCEQCRQHSDCRSLFFDFSKPLNETCWLFKMVCDEFALRPSAKAHYFVRDYIGTKFDHSMK